MVLSAMNSPENIPFHRLSICQISTAPIDIDEDHESLTESDCIFFAEETESENKSTDPIFHRVSVLSRPRPNSMEALSDLSNIGYDGKKKSALHCNSGYGGNNNLRNFETSRSAEFIRNSENDRGISSGVNIIALRKSENDNGLKGFLNNSRNGEKQSSSSYDENPSNLLNRGEKLSSSRNDCNFNNGDKQSLSYGGNQINGLSNSNLINAENPSYFRYGGKQKNAISNTDLHSCETGETNRNALSNMDLLNGENQSYFSCGDKEKNNLSNTDFLNGEKQSCFNYGEKQRYGRSNCTNLINGEKQGYFSYVKNNGNLRDDEKLNNSSGYGGRLINQSRVVNDVNQDTNLINDEKPSNLINGEKLSSSGSCKRPSNLSKLEITGSSSYVEISSTNQKNNDKQRRSFGYDDSGYSSTRSFNTRRSSAGLEEASMAKASRSFSESRKPSRKNSLSARESLLAEAWERKRELMLSEELANMKDRTMRPDLLGRSSSDCGKAVMKKKKALNEATSSPSSSSSDLRRSMTMTRSLTAEDFEELKGCIDLGFHFDQSSVPDLCETLPALEVFCAVSQSFQGSPHRAAAEAMSPVSSSSGLHSPARCSSPSIPSWRISSPGDDPKDVKGRLRHWAQAVACNAKLCY